MSDGPSDAKIDALIASLEKLVGALEKGESGTTGAPGAAAAPRRARLIVREGEEIAEAYEREGTALQKNIDRLQNELDFRGKLSNQKLIQMAQMERELELLEQLNDADDPEQRDNLINQLNDLRDRHQDLNKEFKDGAGKAEKLRRSLTGITGEADRLRTIMPASAEELAGFVTKTIEGITSGETFARIFNKLAAEAFNLSMELDKVNAKLSRETALFQETGTIMDQQARIIRDVESSNRFLGVTAAKTEQAMGALQKSMADFTRMSESDKRTISDTATVMQELGINAGTSAQIFDKATKSLGYQNSEIRGISDELHATAQSLGVPFQQIADDFNMVATELAFYGESAIDVFKDLSKQSKATGLSMQQLLKIGGEAFNTFDGAAQKVGRLNAILGGPYLNSIDMLNASEAQRIDLVKQSMDASGQMFNDLSKYEQLAIADALGVSTEEARRLFGELDASQEMDIRQKEKMEETARKAQATMDKLTNAFRGLLISMDPVVGLFAKFIDIISMLLSSGVVKFFAQAALYAAGTAGALLLVGKAFAALETVFLIGAAIAEIVFAGNIIVAAVGSIISAILSGVATVAGAIAGFFGAIPIAIIAAFVGIGVALYSWFDSLKDKGLSTGEAIKHMFVKIVAAIGLAFTPLTLFMDIMDGLSKGVIEFFAALLSGKGFIEALKQSFNDFVKTIGGGITGKIIAKVFGEEPGKVGTRSVNDAIITTDGQIIEPSKQDTIFAAKPGGPIMDTMSPILNLLGGGTNNNDTNNNTNNNTSMGQQPSNINVIVKIGERQLRDIFIDVLRDTTASSEISGFGGR